MEFVINSKTHLVTKILLFIANYERELRIEVDIRRKRKMKRVIEFVKKNKENSEESRSSTEESVRGNKEASE